MPQGRLLVHDHFSRYPETQAGRCLIVQMLGHRESGICGVTIVLSYLSYQVFQKLKRKKRKKT
jgi:hypothetical protein